MLAEEGYSPLIAGPTTVVARNGSCLDHIFIKSNNLKAQHDAFIYSGLITDHHMIGSTTAFPSLAKKHVQHNRVIKKLDKNKFNNGWHNMQVQIKLESIDTEDATNFLLNCIQTAMSKATKIITQKVTKRKIWITGSLMISVKRKHHLFRRAKHKPYDNELRNEYKKYRIPSINS